MPNYLFKALDHKGQAQTGSLDANSEEEARSIIRQQGLFLTEIVDAAHGQLSATPKAKKSEKKGQKDKGGERKGKVGGKVPGKVLMIFTRQLATLIDAGLPLMKSLSILAKQEPNPTLRATINHLADSVQAGSTFSDSLAQHPRMYNKLYVNMVKAGELGGMLEVVLARLAEYQEKAQKLKSKITSAMVYPCIVMFIAVAIMIFLMLVIVPKFKEMFEGMGMELPAISEFVFSVSGWFMAPTLFIPNFVWLFLVIAALVAIFKVIASNPEGRKRIDQFLLDMPLIGRIQRRSAVARFSRTLGTLVDSGVPILQALQITRETAGNMVVAEAVDAVHNSVKEGESIVTPLSASNVFPPMVVSMVDVGEETGQLPSMLLKVADVYDEEVDTAVTAMTSMLEPLMIVFLAVMVGGIVLAMFLPLIKVIENMG